VYIGRVHRPAVTLWFVCARSHRESELGPDSRCQADKPRPEQRHKPQHSNRAVLGLPPKHLHEACLRSVIGEGATCKHYLVCQNQLSHQPGRVCAQLGRFGCVCAQLAGLVGEFVHIWPVRFCSDPKLTMFGVWIFCFAQFDAKRIRAELQQNSAV
jgi:hypothetical protein